MAVSTRNNPNLKRLKAVLSGRFKIKKLNTNYSRRAVSLTKKSQIASLKQGLTEAMLISRGEMQAIPFSQLWDE